MIIKHLKIINVSAVSFFAIIFLFNCTKHSAKHKFDNLNNGTIGCFGHGGMGIQYKFPIDCKASIDEVLHFGADGSEMDVQLTKDSVLILYHESKLDGTTQCTGIVNDKTWQEIINDDCRFNSPISTSLNLISADSLFSSIKNLHQYTFTFDTKLYNNAADYNHFLQTYANAIIKLVDKYKLQDNLFIEVQDENLLKYLQLKNRNLKYFFYSNFSEALAKATEYNIYGITLNWEDVSAEQIKSAHQKNIRVTLFNMQSDISNTDAMNKNPDFMQSDRINDLLAKMGKYKN